ncbi:MAG: type II toxin-antitoxin system VapC family toxin [Ignavibacteriaceae bacterium]
MNGNSILLDTNIVLYLLNGDKTLIPLLENKQLFVSFITEIELLSYKGIKAKDQTILKEFLSECLIVDINQLIKENTVEIRKKYSLKLPDCIIIATSLYLNIPIISADKEFSKAENADLVLYQK